MKVKEFGAEGLRNLLPFVIKPHENMNIICGENAQGKTNLIEGLWLFSGSKSFRGAKDNEMTAFEATKTALFLSFSDGERTQKAEIVLLPQKKVTLNGVPQKRQSDLTGHFYAVVFSPAHLALVKDGPGRRRKMIDMAIMQIKPEYRHYTVQYEKVLTQRNSLLRDLHKVKNGTDLLEIWDCQLAKLGTIISLYRADYIGKLKPFAEKIYNGISGKKETLSIFYLSTAFGAEVKNHAYTDEAIGKYKEALSASLEQDKRQGITTVGAHRDDLEILIDGHEARLYGSQGQQRSCALSLKLAEASLLKALCGEYPVILLDDVMSELDDARQGYILNKIEGHQVFLTCCSDNGEYKALDGSFFRVEKGIVTPV